MGFNLQTTLSLDQRAFALGLSEAKIAAGKFGHELQHDLGRQLGALKNQFLEAFAVASILEAAHAVFEYANNVQDLSKRLGESADELQAFGAAAKLEASSLETVVAVLEKIKKSQGDAMLGKEKVAERFEVFGLGMEDIARKTPLEVLKAASQNIKEFGLSNERAAAAMHLMGDQVTELFPLMKEGFAEAANQARELGLVISDEALFQLKKLGDEFDKLKLKTKVWGAETILSFKEAFLDSGTRVLNFLESMTQIVPGSKNYNPAPEGLVKNFLDRMNYDQSRGEGGLSDDALEAKLKKRLAASQARRASEEDLTKTDKISNRQPDFFDPLVKIGGFSQFGGAYNDSNRLLGTISEATKELTVTAKQQLEAFQSILRSSGLDFFIQF